MAKGSGHSFLGLLLLILILSLSSSQASAYKFYVGGNDGWMLRPLEVYNHWAARTRFQVNDSLYFKYKVGSDSVLVVNKENYDSCNTTSPIHKMDDGDSEFRLDRSGPFYFISGNVENCKEGQKLIVVVLGIRHKPSQSQSHPPATPPSVAPPPPATPPSAAPSPPAMPPSVAPSPAITQPPAWSAPSLQPSEGPSGVNSPAPSPAQHSGSTRFGGSVGVAMGVSVGVVLFFFRSFA